MSITQQRMIEVINAGLDYKIAFETLIKEIDEAHQLAQGGRLSTQVALETIHAIAGTGLLKKPAASRTALELEYKYFRANWKRNQRQAIKQQRNRKEAGIQPRLPRVHSQFIETTIPAELEIVPFTQQIAQHGYSLSPAHQHEIEAEALRSINQRKYLESKSKPQPPPSSSPAIDLSYDPDDPENFMSPGSSIVSPEQI